MRDAIPANAARTESRGLIGFKPVALHQVQIPSYLSTRS